MDTLKAAWQAMPGGQTNEAALRAMLHNGSHPVQRQVRRQVLVESTCFTVFLAVYYTMFDGDRRPLWMNALLIAGVLLMIGHGVLGYLQSKRVVPAVNVRDALAVRLRQLKTFAALSVVFRMAGTACILAYFAYAVSFTLGKQLLMGWLALALLVQAGLLVWMWGRRIRRLGAALEDMKG